MHIAILTAGGAGMFCGSCMHDNTWAHGLRAAGAEVTLIPAYTPIRVDEDDLSTSRVFLGGVNVYLDYYVPFWRRLPRGLVRWLDSPAVLNLASRLGVSNDAHQLGALTVALLEGEAGPERREIEALVDYLAAELRPDVVCFSNVLMAGVLRRLRQRHAGPVYCLLQGDDIFLDDLIEPYRGRSFDVLRDRAREFDGFLVHSAYYRDFMSQYLNLPRDRFHLLPLGIDLRGHDGAPAARKGDAFTVGYFARVCPEKGLHQLVEAFRKLRARHPQARLRAGGYLGRRDRAYFEKLTRNARDLGPAFEYIGSPATREEKVRFLRSLDAFSVPTEYREPKGLYVLEALANGVPVVQPRHGAFPEMLAGGGGILFEPGDVDGLAAALEELLISPERRVALAAAGQAHVRSHLDDATLARESLRIFSERGSSPHSPGQAVQQESLST